MLDAMLGNAEEIESVGELVSGMGRYDELCSCGERFADCPYWKTVRSTFEERAGVTWDDVVAQSKGQAHIKSLFRTLRGNPADSWVRNLANYTDHIGRAIVETAAKPDLPPNQPPDQDQQSRPAPGVVVDSSKEITRALFIIRFLPDSQVIHLMRHPVSILQSDYYRLKGGTGFKFLRRRFKPKRFFGPFLFVSVLTWVLGNLLADLTRTKGKDRFLRVRYEDIIAQPVAQMERIEKFIGVSLSAVITRLKEGESFAVGHNIGGNHMRLAGQFVFDPRKSGRSGLPKRYAVMAWLLTWPLLLAYGYRGHMMPPTLERQKNG